MPTYTYKREDGSVFEFEQKITEDALKTCPTTGQKVKRIISGGAGLVFKGSGFYLTDYAKKNGASSSGSGDSSKQKSESSSSDSSSDSTSSSTTSSSTSSDSSSSTSSSSTD